MAGTKTSEENPVDPDYASDCSAKMQWVCARWTAFLVACLLFLGGVFYVLWNNPGFLLNADLLPVVGVLVLAFPTTALLSTSFLVSSYMIGVRVSWCTALQVSVLSTAANMLPIPAGTLVRVAALKRAGNCYRESVFATVVAVLVWVGVACVFVGVATIALKPDRFFIWGGFLVVGAGSLLIALILSKHQIRVFLLLSLVHSGVIVIEAGRLYLCLEALSTPTEFSKSVMLALSGVIGTLVGIVPGGLGVSELAGAVLASFVELDPEVGFMAVALNRLASWVIVGFVAMWMTRVKCRS